MYLKTDKITFTVNGLTAYSNDQIPGPLGLVVRPAPKFLLDETALIGWTDGVDVKRSSQARPVSDGDFSEPTYFNSRVIIASGYAIANSVGQLHQMRDQFTKVLSDKKYRELAVTTGAGTRYATVSLANKPGWIQETDLTAAWKLELYAPDPYIYGEEQVVQTSINQTIGGLTLGPLSFPLDFDLPESTTTQIITNKGNAKMWPKFRITGNYTAGFTITNNMNQKVTYNGVVTQFSPVVIDMGKGTAIQDNTDRSYLITDRDWISVDPGQSIRPDFIPIENGLGWCEAVYRDTWI